MNKAFTGSGKQMIKNEVNRYCWSPCTTHTIHCIVHNIDPTLLCQHLKHCHKRMRKILWELFQRTAPELGCQYVFQSVSESPEIETVFGSVYESEIPTQNRHEIICLWNAFVLFFRGLFHIQQKKALIHYFTAIYNNLKITDWILKLIWNLYCFKLSQTLIYEDIWGSKSFDFLKNNINPVSLQWDQRHWNNDWNRSQHQKSHFLCWAENFWNKRFWIKEILIGYPLWQSSKNDDDVNYNEYTALFSFIFKTDLIWPRVVLIRTSRAIRRTGLHFKSLVRVFEKWNDSKVSLNKFVKHF